MDPNETRHPSSFSEQERADLRASDPSAYDDEPASEAALAAAVVGAGAAAAPAKGEQGKEGDAAVAAAAGAADDKSGKGAKPDAAAATADDTAAADAAAVAAATAAAGAGKEGEGDAKKGDLIPKARFDEVNGKVKDLQREVDNMRAREQAIKAPVSDRDFDAEEAALAKRYEESELDLVEFQKEMNKVGSARAAHAAVAAVYEHQKATALAATEQTWNDTIGAWTAANAEFMGNAIRQNAVATLLDQYGKDPNLSDADLLAKVQKEAFEAFNWTPPGTTPAATVVDPHAGRNAADARSAAAASSTPPEMTGGVGARGGPAAAPDMSTVKPGTFSKSLSKADQEKLLGEGAV